VVELLDRGSKGMAGTSPAMTQIVEIKVNRHVRPCAGHQQGPLGMALFIEFVDFFASC
jgi:hypothetical protein